MNLPSGTVTFLFTDIEGSARLWDMYPEQMRAALARHDALLRTHIEACGGAVFKTIGDAFCAAFASAADALLAACGAQRALEAEAWEAPLRLRVRMVLHTGVADERDGDYFGPPLNRAARLLDIGHGGQTLVSGATQALLHDALPHDAALKDMGTHRLRDLAHPEAAYQLLHPDLPADFPPLRSLNSPNLPNNLPQQATSFIGREREIADVRRLLASSRLLTLIGSGGSGKTRLSLQVAAEMLEDYPDGVWQIELAPLSDPALVARTVAQALEIAEAPGQPMTRALADALKARTMLLLLDNCEHLLTACAQLADALLRACPNVRLLATSREALNIAGEQTYRIPSLGLPDPDGPLVPETLADFESVRLFLDRVALNRPDFAMTRANAPAVAGICAQLDGIPLALELAAARVRSLAVEEIHTRLDNRFRLLTGGSRAALPRQQTLRALVDWSYDLLNAQEKLLLHRLSVFAGGFTLAAAEAVCADTAIEDWEVLDLLTGLADKSLAVAEESEGATRYRLLETVRQYAAEKLREDGAQESLRARHRDYFLKMAEDIQPRLNGPEQVALINTLEREHPNIRVAFDWCLEEEAGAEPGLRLAGALLNFWHRRGHLSEGRKRYAAVLAKDAAAAPTPARAAALHGQGGLAYYQGDYDESRAGFEQALAICQHLGDRQGMTRALGNLGSIAQYRGDYPLARERFEYTLTIYRETGDRAGEAIALMCLGSLAKSEGESAAAESHLQQALAINRELGNRNLEAENLRALGDNADDREDLSLAQDYYEQALALHRQMENRREEATVLISYGGLARQRREFAAARAYCRQALVIVRELGLKRMIAFALEMLADIAADQAQAEKAARFWGAAEAQREEMKMPRTPGSRDQYELAVRAAREQAGAEIFDRAWAEGRAMTRERAMDYALESADS